MKMKIFYLLVLFGIFPLLAQVSVSGVVTDESNSPIPGVSVLVKGTTRGVATDFDGKYQIEAQSGEVLVFTSIGFVPQEISVGGGNRLTINVLLKEDTQQLDEVVVVGFGTQKKVNLTGAVTSVDSKALASRPVSTVTEALQGIVPGLNISTSNVGGQLNATRSINVRGTGTIGDGSTSGPLVLIDGMEGNMNALNPNDIENISILKDAAASSIYGSRAPFGVILITTKKGKDGRVSVNYSSSLRADSPIVRPKMADSYSFALYFNDADVGGTQFSDEKLQQILDFQNGTRTQYAFVNSVNRWEMWDDAALLPVANTNWIDEHYKKTAYSKEHNLSVSGGTDKSQYYLSANFLDRDGLFRYAPESFDRYSLTGKINAQLSKRFSVGYSTRFVRENYEAPSYLQHNAVFFHDIIRYWPIIPLKDPNGYFTQESKVLQLTEGGRQKSEKDWLYMQLSSTFDITGNWNLIAEFNYKTYNEFLHNDYLTTYAYDASRVPFVIENQNSAVSEYVYKDNFFNPNIYSNYSLDLDGGHEFKFMAGFQSELLKSRNLGASRQGIISPMVPVLDKTTTNPRITNGGYGHWATAGFFGRVNYNYKGRYLLEVNGRYDGTSRFLKDQRWKFFPSVSAGWNIAQENFWEPMQDAVSTLKLRASWGELGNQNMNNWYPFYSSMGIWQNAGQWILGETRPNISGQPALVSSLLTWETIRSWNIGLDVTALNNRLTATFDYFKRYTDNMIGPAPELPPTLGIAVPKTNNADMVSSGFELSLSWRDRIGDDFSYGVAVLLSDARQKILKYPNPSFNLNQWYEGRYVGEIWGYTTIGIAKTQAEMDAHLATTNQNRLGSNWSAGDIMYADLDGDGAVSNGENRLGNSGDLSIIGNSTARYNYGITLDAAYKGFDARLFLQGVGKRDYATGGSYFWGASGGKWQTVVFQEHLDYFRDDPNHPLGLNTDSYYPRADWSGGGNRNRQTQTRYLQDASYLRVKNVQVGYSIPREMLANTGLENCRIYVSGENVMTFTKLSKLYDPEMLGIGYGNEGAKTYPLSKTWSLGVNITF
ncbi:MAG: TonB-dependent receptor [Capnocytophaga sp.]|nr:TonB-dependent receptor [Capnocytophaga sp.]